MLFQKNVEIDNRGLATKGVKLFNNNSLDINQNHDGMKISCLNIFTLLTYIIYIGLILNKEKKVLLIVILF